MVVANQLNIVVVDKQRKMAVVIDVAEWQWHQEEWTREAWTCTLRSDLHAIVIWNLIQIALYFFF